MPAETITAATEFVVTTLAVLAGTAAVGVAAVGTAFWLVVRRVRRSKALRRGVDRGLLGARSVVSDGAGRQGARLQLAIAREREATTRALTAAGAQGRPVGELPAIAEHLETVAAGLDERLRLVEREPDPALRARLTERIAGEVGEYRRLATGVRESAMGNHSAAAELGAAAERLQIEGEALRSWDRRADRDALPDPGTGGRG
ncbi:hypothetical protein OCAE111667_24290 [Occultella aeris]|uniref:Secreted protein n=1 Tax=Occultella aeris TaxID=2761496 RepID=A0A7M4DEN1_9MICO|nr:hypothetical protein [Occultella aeris]VZO35374.1 hypothetical protein HALOF300_00571 [Occultella aeris]